jgi:hypothetical protein
MRSAIYGDIVGGTCTPQSKARSVQWDTAGADGSTAA